MANLGPLYQNQTYGNLLQVDGGLTAELKPVLDGDGNESGLTLSLTGVGISGLVAASASNLNAGLAGTVPYQIAPNVTGFTTVGAVGSALVSNGTGAPSWSNTIQNSTYSSLAVDVSGGAAGQVLYQSDANNTSFTGVGTLGQVLVSGGAAAPYWSTSVPAAGVAGSASNISGGVSGNLLYQADVGLTHYVNNGTSGQLLRSQGSAAPVWATVTAADVGSLPLDGSTAMTGNLSMGSHTITNLLNPLASTDAANKAYVDSVATGLKIKSACRVASTTNLVLSGLISVDGVTVNNADRVLVKNQSFPELNGIYVASATSWTRATDAETWEELTGATCFITEGSTQANTTWACNITAGGTIGVTPITFVLFGSSTSYTAGTGLTLVGSQFALATPVSVANGGSGVTTLTGIVKGNGASAFTAATGADVVSLIGATAVQNATTAASCSGNALTATTLQTARTINGVSFNGSANITVTANTTGSLNVVSNGLGDAAPFSFNGSVTRDLSYNSIGAAAVGGSNATGTWPISITGNAANISGIVGTVNGGTGYASYAIGDLLYASAPTVLSKLPIASSDFILRSNGTVPAWGKVELNTTVVTGTLPTTRGGTGLAAPFGTLGAVYTNGSTTLTTGILPVAYGGTGASTLTGYVKGNGDSAMTAVASIPNTDVSGLGTLSTQNANAVTLTGGTLNNTTIGATTQATGAFTSLTSTSSTTLDGTLIPPSKILVTTDSIQALTNKTLTIPTISGGTITGTRSVSPNTTDFLRADGAWAAPTTANWQLNGSAGNQNTYLITDPNNALLLNASGRWTTGDALYARFQITDYSNAAGSGGGYPCAMGMFSVNNSPYAGGPTNATFFGMFRSNGTALNDYGTALQENQDLGEHSWHGSDGTKFIKGAIWNAGSDGAYALNSAPSRLFGATRASDPDPSSYGFNLKEAFRLDSEQTAWHSNAVRIGQPLEYVTLRRQNYGNEMLVVNNNQWPCVAATTANITLSGAQTLDGVAVVAGNLVLVKNQSSSAQNGIYTVQTGAWYRANPASTWSNLYNSYVYVTGGTTQSNSLWQCTSASAGIVGTTALPWTRVYSYTNGIANFYIRGCNGGGAQINATTINNPSVPIYGFYYDGITGVGNPAAGITSVISVGTEIARWSGSGYQVNNLAGTGNRAVYSTPAGLLTNTSSDSSLKENVLPIADGLAKVNQLNGVSFTWKDTELYGDQREIGFIAQEVEAIIPEVIGINSDDTLSLDYPKLTALLVEAIKELSAKVDALENNNG